MRCRLALLVLLLFEYGYILNRQVMELLILQLLLPVPSLMNLVMCELQLLNDPEDSRLLFVLVPFQRVLLFEAESKPESLPHSMMFEDLDRALQFYRPLKLPLFLPNQWGNIARFFPTMILVLLRHKILLKIRQWFLFPESPHMQ